MAISLIEILKVSAVVAFLLSAYYAQRLANYTQGGAVYWKMLAISAFAIAFSLVLELLSLTGIFGQDLTLYMIISETIRLAAGVTFGYFIYGMYKILSTA